MLTRIKHTQFFKCTLKSTSFLDGYEKHQRKLRKSIENARWKCEVRNDRLLQKFLFEYRFKYHSMENWNQYTGKIDGFTIWINFGKKTTLVISHPTIYGGNFLDEYKQAEDRILILLGNLNKKWNFNLTIPVPVEALQFTIADPFADYLMRKTGGSQVKLEKEGKKISFDQSYHTEPRTEFSELPEAMKWANLPEIVIKNSEDIEIIKKRMSVIPEILVQNSQDIEIIKKSLLPLPKSMNDIAESLKAIKEVLEGGTKEKPPEKPKPLDDYTSRMFG